MDSGSRFGSTGKNYFRCRSADAGAAARRTNGLALNRRSREPKNRSVTENAGGCFGELSIYTPRVW